MAISYGRAVLDEINTRLLSVLGSSFSEHIRSHALTSLPAIHLENGYSCVFGEGIEEAGNEFGSIRITRPIIISVTYRTFSHSLDDKTKTKEDTVLDNEEKIIIDLINADLTNGTLLDVSSTNISTFFTEEDTFLLNEITMNGLYTIYTC